MKPLLLFFSGIFFSAIKSYAQDTAVFSSKMVSGSEFTDCYGYKNGLAALAKNGNLFFIDYSKGSASKITDKKYARVGVDRKGILWVADSASVLWSLQDTGWRKEVIIAAPNIWAIVFSQKNKLLLVTSLGIYNSATEMFYGINRSGDRVSSFFPRTGYKIKCFYVDEKDNLWINGRSRMVDEVHVFSIRLNTFITNKKKGTKLWFSGLQNIFGYRKNIFFTEMGNPYTGDGCLYSYGNDTLIRMHHPEYDTMTIGPSEADQVIIGGAFYNEEDKNIYYYSNSGLMKATFNRSNRKLGQETRICAPYYLWNGYKMDSRTFVFGMEKMFYYHHAIIYLNRAEGIFVWNGKVSYNFR